LIAFDCSENSPSKYKSSFDWWILGGWR
jgi:hypothetical protein